MSAAKNDHLKRESQWSIAMQQFGKRWTSVWGLRGATLLLIIAIYAPVVSSGLPFTWTDADGVTTYPWFSQMFNQNYWTGAVDRIFNLVLVMHVLWLVFSLGVRLVAKIKGWTAARRQSLMDPLRKRALILTVFLIVLQVLPFATFMRGNQPYVDYVAKMKAAEAAGEEVPGTFTVLPFGPRAQDKDGRAARYIAPMDFTRGRHVLGTDKLGRDVLTRLLYGTRISLTVGLVAVGIYVTIGIIMGGLAGYVGGWTDIGIMRLIEIILCVPGLFLILTIISLFDTKSIFMIMLAIGIVGWTGIARLVRGEFIRERGKDYVTAAKSLGYSGSRVLFRHILPNAVGPVFVSATFGIAGAIITESTLSFLGLGDPTVASWGQMLSEGRMDQQWHMIASPGIAIFFTVTLLNLVGDGLRDALDPKLRK